MSMYCSRIITECTDHSTYSEELIYSLAAKSSVMKEKRGRSGTLPGKKIQILIKLYSRCSAQLNSGRNF